MKKYYIFFFLILFFNYNSLYSLIDSLEKSLKHLSGEDRVVVLNQLASEYVEFDIEKSYKYSLEAIELNNFGNNYQLANSYIQLSYYYQKKKNLTKADEYIQKVHKLIPDLSNEAKLVVYSNLPYYFKLLNLPDSSKHYTNLTLDYINYSENDLFKLEVQNKATATYINLQDYERGLSLAEETIVNAKKAKNKYFEGIANGNIGMILRLWDKFEQSVAKFDVAIDAIEKELEKTGSKSINKKNLYVHLFNFYNNKAISLSSIEKYEQSVESLLKARFYNSELNDLLNEAQINTNIGMIFYNQKQYDSAVYYFNTAAIQAESLKEYEGLIINYNNLASSYYFLDDLKNALIYANKAYILSDTVKLDMWKIYVLRNLATIHYDLGNYKDAFDYKEIFHQIQDSVKNVELELKIADIESQVDLEIERNKSKSLEDTKELYIWIIILILIIVAITLVSNYFRLKSKEKINNLLTEKNNEINQKNNELNEINEELKTVINTKDKFFSIISHDLRSPIGSFLNLTKLLHESYDDFSEEEKIDSLEAMKESIENIYGLLNNLLEWSQSQRGDIKFEPDELNLAYVANNSVNLLKSNANSKNIEIISNINKDFNLLADYEMLSSIFNNLISNSIKFTNEGGSIVLDAKKDEDYIDISIKDSGIGMDEQTRNKLFKIDEHITSKGTKGEIGSGLGLILCYEFVKKHNGNIRLESEVGKGTTFYIKLPVRKQ